MRNRSKMQSHPEEEASLYKKGKSQFQGVQHFQNLQNISTMPMTQFFELNHHNCHDNYSLETTMKKVLQQAPNQKTFYRLASSHSNIQPQQHVKKVENQLSLQTQNNQQLRSIFSERKFPNTEKLLDLNHFISQNVILRRQLLQNLQKIKEKQNNLKNFDLEVGKGKSSTRDTTLKQLSREKTFSQKKQLPEQSSQAVSKNKEDQEIRKLSQLKRVKQEQLESKRQKLQEIRKENKLKMEKIEKQKNRALQQSIHETPMLRQKQQIIQYLSIQVEWLNDKSSHLKRLARAKNEKDLIFEMYEQMCREIEILRKENNRKSQILKDLFQKTNQLTAKEENINMFLMNIKV